MELTLTQQELNLIISALTEFSATLANRFEDNARYVHPKLKYEALAKKIDSYQEPLPVSIFTIISSPTIERS
jgi:hypothetical protein